jgi:hypothetical protein
MRAHNTDTGYSRVSTIHTLVDYHVYVIISQRRIMRWYKYVYERTVVATMIMMVVAVVDTIKQRYHDNEDDGDYHHHFLDRIMQ